jgi:N-carbamoyl-L-amino-acid hydrolase
MPPVGLDPGITDLIAATAEGLGLSVCRMPSGAGHDAQVMAAIAPTGMIFVPSKNGWSHSRLEHTDWEDVENGANVLLGCILELTMDRWRFS